MTLTPRRAPRPLAAAQVPGLLRPGMNVYVAGSSGEPSTLFEVLKAQSPAAAGVHFIQFPIPPLNATDFTALTPTTRQSVFFRSPALRDAEPARLHFVPMHMRRVVDRLVAEPPDLALLQVAADADGVLRIAANADFAGAVCDNGHTRVVAALNPDLPVPRGAPSAAGRIDDLVEDLPGFVPEFPAPKIDDVAARIGAHVAGLIRDGDCLQTGIGAIPAAVLGGLSDKRDLGFHGGLIDDGVLALIECGAMTGQAKTFEARRHVAGMVLASAAAQARLAERDDVDLRGADHTHEAGIIARIDNFVSINSAVEVDVMGQINGEFAGGRQISGTGGSVDFMRAVRGSRGGRSIVALPATARGGSVSRIVERVEMVTALRTDVDLVVTEHGVADLRDRSLGERRERLAAIAAPEFRDALLKGEEL
ncbi:MAG: acetyl-CoA hydrolase/transferase C-terminal domain-containing protein [Pseudomonadota bacterium]